jgi:hypothetical protein
MTKTPGSSVIRVGDVLAIICTHHAEKAWLASTKGGIEKKKAAPKERQKTVTSNEREKP